MSDNASNLGEGLQISQLFDIEEFGGCGPCGCAVDLSSRQSGRLVRSLFLQLYFYFPLRRSMKRKMTSNPTLASVNA